MTPFERHIKYQQKKKKNIDDQKILDSILASIKKRNDDEYQKKVDEARENLDNIINMRK